MEAGPATLLGAILSFAVAAAGKAIGASPQARAAQRQAKRGADAIVPMPPMTRPSTVVSLA
jgi:hypothetical protein